MQFTDIDQKDHGGERERGWEDRRVKKMGGKGK